MATSPLPLSPVPHHFVKGAHSAVYDWDTVVLEACFSPLTTRALCAAVVGDANHTMLSALLSTHERWNVRKTRQQSGASRALAVRSKLMCAAVDRLPLLA